MPTLPDFTDLRAMPSGRSDRRVSTFDTTAIGEGMSGLGSGLTSAADSLRDLWQKHENAQAEHGSLAFLADDQARCADLQKTATGGDARGLSNQYLADATARIQAYVLTLPPRLQQATYDRLTAEIDRRYGEAQTFEAGAAKAATAAHAEQVTDMHTSAVIAAPLGDVMAAIRARSGGGNGGATPSPGPVDPTPGAPTTSTNTTAPSPGGPGSSAPPAAGTGTPNGEQPMSSAPGSGLPHGHLNLTELLAAATDAGLREANQATAAKVTRYFQTSSELNDLANRLAQGTAGAFDVTRAVKQGIVRTADERKALYGVLDDALGQAAATQAAVGMFIDPNHRFHPRDQHARDVADYVYAAAIQNAGGDGGGDVLAPPPEPATGLFGAPAPPAAGTAQPALADVGVAIAKRTGAAPTAMVHTIAAGLRSPDPARRERAASLLQEVEAASPPAARQAFSHDDFRRAFVFQALQKAVPPDALAKAVAVPDAKALADQDALAAVGAERALTTTTPGRVAFAVLAPLSGEGGAPPALTPVPGAANALHGTFVGEFARAFAVLPQDDAAHDVATGLTQRQWGVSD